MSKSRQRNPEAWDRHSAFGQTVQEALQLFTDPIALGTHSPLTAPYLLGSALPADAVDAQARGRALQRVLRATLDSLTAADQQLHRTILQERYFKGQTAVAVQLAVGLGKTQYHAHQQQALNRFEKLLLAELQPAIRLERPVQEQELLFERDAQGHACWRALQRGQTVILSGPGGVGKTALGSELARRWGTERAFWFTIRPGLNDHLHSFVFALGYFCHKLGSSSLWQQLIATNGNTPTGRLTEIVRFTVEQLATPPLLCVDEADLLQPADAGSHAQLMQLILALRDLAPLLLIGQKVVMEADHHEPLRGLSPRASMDLLLAQNIQLDAYQQQQLIEYTAGNPRLLHLLIALHNSGEAVTDLLPALPPTPSLHFLLGRILQRLSATEVGVVMQLAVFQKAAPADEWQRNTASDFALSLLHNRRLIQHDEQGGVFLLPAFRDALALEMPAVKLNQLHKRAAEIFLRRGAYTAAVYHLSRSDAPEAAIWLWKTVQEQEINQGQAYTALTIFRSMASMPSATLSTAAREQVYLFCAALENLVGSAAKAQADLGAILWQTPLLALEADEMGGVIANNLSQFEEAERYFRRAQAKAEAVVEARLAQIHKGLAWMHWRESNLDAAEHELGRARYEVENLEGRIRASRGDYAGAVAHYKAALAIAEALRYDDGMAKTCNNLFNQYTNLGQFAMAQEYYQQAEAIYQRIGNAIAIDGIAINYAVFHNQAGNHQTAAMLLERILAQKQTQPGALTPNLATLIYQGLAEAYLGLGELDKAEEYVQRAIALEEISILPDSYRTHGEIMLQRGRLELAETLIRHSLALLAEHSPADSYLAAYAWRALVSVHLAQADHIAAGQARTKATDLFQTLNLQQEIDKIPR